MVLFLLYTYISLLKLKLVFLFMWQHLYNRPLLPSYHPLIVRCRHTYAMLPIRRVILNVDIEPNLDVSYLFRFKGT